MLAGITDIINSWSNQIVYQLFLSCILRYPQLITIFHLFIDVIVEKATIKKLHFPELIDIE